MHGHEVTEGSFHPGQEGTVSQRRSINARVVEGTEVFIATVALFGKVSADRAVRFVFHNLGAILRWAGILDKRPAFEPSRVSLFFVKAFPGGTPMARPRKRRFSVDPPPTTTIWTTPGAKASPHWASTPGRRRETQQRWNHWSSCSRRTSVKRVCILLCLASFANIVFVRFIRLPVAVRSFSLQCSFPLHTYITTDLSILLMMDMWVASSLGLM